MTGVVASDYVDKEEVARCGRATWDESWRKTSGGRRKMEDNGPALWWDDDVEGKGHVVSNEWIMRKGRTT